VDRIIPLKRGGADDPSDMQWQTAADAKEQRIESSNRSGNKSVMRHARALRDIRRHGGLVEGRLQLPTWRRNLEGSLVRYSKSSGTT
jgi:hypothetical protein